MIILDSALPCYAQVRREAMAAEFIDWQGHDGQVYKRVCLTEVPGLQWLIESVYGTVEMLGMGYRLNYAGEMPNQSIHSDLGWGTHAAVVYLCEGYGGTAFWKHRATGATRIDVGDVELMEALGDSWERPEDWQMIDLCPLVPNRAVFYEGALFHSRWPFEAFGDNPSNGRLIAVAFFTPKDGNGSESNA